MGQIVDQSTGKAHCLCEHRCGWAGVGTVSDDQGMFRLRIDDLPDDAILRYSMLGYQSIDQELRQVRQAAISSGSYHPHDLHRPGIAADHGQPQGPIKAIRAGNARPGR